MNSLNRIALTTLTILATGTFIYLLYQSLAFIGQPLGKTLINLLITLSGEGHSDPNDGSFIGAMLSFFIFVIMFALALDSTEPPQWFRRAEIERLISTDGLWVSWAVVQSWGETLVVVGILSGVVKGLGLC
jgi:hypothetical protein